MRVSIWRIFLIQVIPTPSGVSLDGARIVNSTIAYWAKQTLWMQHEGEDSPFWEEKMDAPIADVALHPTHIPERKTECTALLLQHTTNTHNTRTTQLSHTHVTLTHTFLSLHTTLSTQRTCIHTTRNTLNTAHTTLLHLTQHTTLSHNTRHKTLSYTTQHTLTPHIRSFYGMEACTGV